MDTTRTPTLLHAHSTGPAPLALPDPRHVAAPIAEPLPLPSLPMSDRAALLVRIRTLQTALETLLGREVGP